MTIAFDINDNPVSGLEWRMWWIPDKDHRTFICASRKNFSTRAEVIEEVKRIGTSMKANVELYTGEETEYEQVHSLFKKKEPAIRKDIDG